MKFEFNLFYKTALIIATENENPEIVQLLLSRPEIDVNIKSILIITY